MLVKCKKDSFQNIFEFMNYTEFVLGQKFPYKTIRKKDLSKYYFHAYCVLLNDMLKTHSGSLHQYAKLRHNIDLDSDIKLSIKKIKKKLILGNKVDYRFVLVSQLLHALELLNINTLKEEDKVLLQKKLCFSKKNFALALEYAKDHGKIKNERILKSFAAHVNFKDSHNKYKQTKVKHIGICANMSCGKSTFVNALLGNDYLPARNESTTACITSVYDYDNAKSMIGVAVKNDHIYAIGDNMDTVTINKWNSEADHIILESDLDNISNNNIVVAVHDTPGINNSGNDNHSKITMNFLSQNKMDAIIYVANAEHLATEDDKNLLVELRDKILPKSKSKMLFVINKFDSIDISKESKDDIVIRYLEFLENLGFEKPKIYPISSKAARLFKMALNGRVYLFSENELDEFKPLVNKFNKRLNLAANNDVFYIKETIQRSLEFGESITLDGGEVEIQKIYQALKNTGLLGLESDIETLLSNDEMQRGNSTLPEIFFSKAK